MYRFSFSSIPKLRSLLARIGESAADLANMLNESESTIRDHCDSIRLQVDIARETALEKIHKESNALLAEMDAYESACLSSWSTAKKSTQNVVASVSKRMSAFLAEQQEYLQRVRGRDDDDEDVILQLDAANKLAQELSDHKKGLTATMFDHKLASFHASPGYGEASLGELAFAHFRFPFNKLRPVDARSDYDFVLPLDEGQRFVTFAQMRKEKHVTQMSCFDSVGRLICSKRLEAQFHPKRVAQCGPSEFVALSHSNPYELSVYDSALQLLRSVCYCRSFEQICCNSKFVFGLWQDKGGFDYNKGKEEQYSSRMILLCQLDTLKEAFGLLVPAEYRIERIMVDECHVVALSRLEDSKPESDRWDMSIFDLATFNESGDHQGARGLSTVRFLPVKRHIVLMIEPMLLSSVFLFDGWMAVPLENANELVWFNKSGRRRETSTELDNISNVRAIYSHRKITNSLK